MNTVIKCVLLPRPEQFVRLPLGFKTLQVTTEGGDAVLWVRVNSDEQERVDLKIYRVGMKDFIPADANEFLGVANLANGAIDHIFKGPVRG